jgi:hypothetical protein
VDLGEVGCRRLRLGSQWLDTVRQGRIQLNVLGSDLEVFGTVWMWMWHDPVCKGTASRGGAGSGSVG